MGGPTVNVTGPDFSFAVPVHNHTNHHFHGAHHHFPEMPTTFDSARSDLSTSNSSVSTFTFSSPALSSISTNLTSPSKHAQIYPPHYHHHHGGPHQSSPLGNGDSKYRCQWSDCVAIFPTREELVGHVNVTHLLNAQSAATQMAQSHASAFVPSGDPALDSTLRCLWDSCEAALPVVDSHVPLADAAQLNSHGSTAPAMTTSKSQDTSTATLVRHLLQDHLHLPAELLSHLESSVASPQGVQTKHNNGAHTQNVQYGPHDQVGRLGSLSAFSSPASLASATPPLSNRSQQINNAPTYYPDFDSAYLDARAPPSSGGDLGTLGSSVFDGESFSVEISRVSTPGTAVVASNFGAPAAYTSGENQFKCYWSGCSAHFESTSLLMDHVSDNHVGSGKSLYHCHWEGCARAQEGKGFTQRQKIMRHLRTHVG